MSLSTLTSMLEKKFGKGSAMLLREKKGVAIPRWKIDSLKISDVMGGGIPKGRIMELYGPEAAGKTSIACYLAGQVQAQGDKVAYIDVEHAIDPDYAETFGLNLDEVVFAQPDSGEEALDIVQAIAESGEVKFIVVDSVANLVTKAELEGEMGDMQMGALARLMGKALRKLTAIISNQGVTILFINQVRDSIGSYGDPESTPGGKALKFYSSIRLRVARKDWIKQSDKPIGIISILTGKKNKTAPPMRKQEISILFGQSIQAEDEYAEFAVNLGIIERKGAWYFYNGEQIGQGIKGAVAYLEENPSVYDTVIKQVDEILFPSQDRTIKFQGKEEVEEEPKKRGRKKKEEESSEVIEEEESEVEFDLDKVGE